MTLYTIGIDLNNAASRYMQTLASENCYVNLTGDDLYTQLNSVLTNWGKTIASVAAGKNAEIVDMIRRKGHCAQ